ncbi:MAG: N-acetyltransferase family protein [Chloroflexota bacterium]|nr:N-acetyltransferase family protein [Chloroflexota bacterium]
MSECTLREATVADQSAIMDIYNDAVLHSTATFDLDPRTWEVQQQWFQQHRPPHRIFVATLGDAVAGWGSLSPFRPKPGYRFTAEDSIYVHKDFRGRGMGAALLGLLIEAARRGRFHSIMALIDGDNTVSVHLHERFGFRHVGTFPQVGFKFGRWLDVVHMQRVLE